MTHTNTTAEAGNTTAPRSIKAFDVREGDTIRFSDTHQGLKSEHTMTVSMIILNFGKGFLRFENIEGIWLKFKPNQVLTLVDRPTPEAQAQA